jgi:hypothetical protein
MGSKATKNVKTEPATEPDIRGTDTESGRSKSVIAWTGNGNENEFRDIKPSQIDDELNTGLGSRSATPGSKSDPVQISEEIDSGNRGNGTADDNNNKKIAEVSFNHILGTCLIVFFCRV